MVLWGLEVGRWEVERWGGGEVERWRGGEVERWGGEEVEREAWYCGGQRWGGGEVEREAWYCGGRGMMHVLVRWYCIVCYISDSQKLFYYRGNYSK